MALTTKFKKDVQTLRGAANGEFFLDVKNPKLFKKVRKFYENDGVTFSGDPLQIGYFDGTASNLGLDAGIVMSSGDVAAIDPNNFGGNARTGSVLVTGASEEFHVYEMEWTETEIKFAVDGIVYHTVSNDGTLPFNKDFFFILNVAMGGSFGGNIDANFMESTMEVDYIRMYQ